MKPKIRIYYYGRKSADEFTPAFRSAREVDEWTLQRSDWEDFEIQRCWVVDIPTSPKHPPIRVVVDGLGARIEGGWATPNSKPAYPAISDKLRVSLEWQALDALCHLSPWNRFVAWITRDRGLDRARRAIPDLTKPKPPFHP